MSAEQLKIREAVAMAWARQIPITLNGCDGFSFTGVICEIERATVCLTADGITQSFWIEGMAITEKAEAVA